MVEWSELSAGCPARVVEGGVLCCAGVDMMTGALAMRAVSAFELSLFVAEFSLQLGDPSLKHSHFVLEEAAVGSG